MSQSDEIRWFSLRESNFPEQVFHLSIIAFGRRNGSSEQRPAAVTFLILSRCGKAVRGDPQRMYSERQISAGAAKSEAA
jgi:hypothetical protein